MPVEIKELLVRVTVNEQQSNNNASAVPAGQDARDEKKIMIQQCIDEVMDIINSKKER